MIVAVEARFGSTGERAIIVEFLGDNGGAFRTIETHALAHELGIKPVHGPVNSLESNGMAASFVNTFKRDHVACMDRGRGATVLAQVPDAFRHFDEVSGTLTRYIRIRSWGTNRHTCLGRATPSGSRN
jgi:transposase InsO family protein